MPKTIRLTTGPGSLPLSLKTTLIPSSRSSWAQNFSIVIVPLAQYRTVAFDGWANPRRASGTVARPRADPPIPRMLSSRRREMFEA